MCWSTLSNSSGIAAKHASVGGAPALGLSGWSMVAEQRVAGTVAAAAAGDASGRALALTIVGGGDGAPERIVCGTSDGDIVTLRARDLAISERLSLDDASGKRPRVTAITALTDESAGGGEAAVVVGDSNGALRVHKVGL